jgi:hypothetical protein
MFEQLQTDLEPAWAGCAWYGSVFGAICVLSAVGVALSFFKQGSFRFLVGPCYLVAFALSLHSFFIAMRRNPPTKKLSFRMSFLSLLVVLPWMVRPFLEQAVRLLKYRHVANYEPSGSIGANA